MTFEGSVAIIGAGSVGGAIAFGLLMHESVREILLVDMSQGILEGQVLDLTEASSGTGKVVRAGTFQEAGKSDIIVLTAEVLCHDEEPHDKSIVDAMDPIQPKALVIAVSDPVEFTVRYIQDHTHLDNRQIFGLGTSLANARFRRWLAHLTGASDTDIDAFVLGTRLRPVPAWDAATVLGHPLASVPDLVSNQSTALSVVSCERTDYIRECKGGPWYGIAAAVVRLISGMLQQPVIEVLTVYAPQYGAHVALPVVVTIYGGVIEFVDIQLSDDEAEELKRAASEVKNDFHF